MRLSAQEKAKIVLLVSRSDLCINPTLSQFGIHKRTFNNYYHDYSAYGIECLKAKRMSNKQKNLVIDLALAYSDHSPRIPAVKMLEKQGLFI